MGGSKTRAASHLDNGVAVVIEENHAAPVIAIQVWVAAGAADDPPALAGAAHLFEHLVFRGTHRRAAGAAAQEIEAVGGTLGAWTGLDETVYHVALAAPFLGLGLDVLADALTGPTFDPGQVDRERKLVAEEIAREAIFPARAATEALRAATFGAAGDGRSLLGTPAGALARTPAELAARFAETYVGANLTVVVVGDVEALAAQAAVARAFAAVPRGKASRPSRAAERPAGPQVVWSATAGASEVVIGFHLSAPSAEDAAALDLLAALLSRGDGARLPRELIQNRALADAVRGFTFDARGEALLGLVLSPAPRRLEAAAQTAVDEALRLARQEVPADELSRVRAEVAGDLARGEAGVEGHARRLGFGAAIAGDLDYGARYRERLELISPAELRAAAGRILRVAAVTISVKAPLHESGRGAGDADGQARLTAMLAGAEARADRERATQAAPELNGDVVRVVAPSGLRILVLRDTTAPLVTVEAAWAGGARQEDGGSNGAATFIAALLDRGTRTRSAADIAGELHAIGGSLSGFADGNHFGLQAEFLAPAATRGLSLLADCLLHPSFPAEAVDSQRRVLLDRLRIAGDDPARAARQLFREALWPQHPFRFDPLGSAQVLATMGRMRLLEHYRRHYPLSQLVLTVVGDVDPAAIVSTLTSLLAEAAGDPAQTKARGVDGATPAVPVHSEPVAVFRATSKDVAQVVLGYPGPPVGDPDRLAAQVLAEVLSTAGGGLQNALAGEAPLAYQVQVSAARGVEPGFLSVALGCPPARVDAAVAAVRAALARVAADGVTADEVARAARRRAGALALGLSGPVAIADALALDEAYGLGLMSYRQVPAALSRVTADEVTRAARRLLDPKREVIAVVRPPETPASVLRAAAAKAGGR